MCKKKNVIQESERNSQVVVMLNVQEKVSIVFLYTIYFNTKVHLNKTLPSFFCAKFNITWAVS